MLRILSALLFLCLPSIIFAQVSTADEEGLSQINPLKKLNKKADYGVWLIEKEYSFGTTRGFSGDPAVSATEKATIDMVSLEKNAIVGYVLPYNQFMQIRDYDFNLYTKKGFRRQKYPPEKIGLTSESVYLDDNFGQLYGFRADEAGTRCRFTYDYSYTDAKYLTRVFFHQQTPINKYVVSFKVPSWLLLDIAEKNFGAEYAIRKTVKKEKDFTIYTYTADNLEGVKQESSSLGRPYYLPHLIITVRGYTIDQKTYRGFQNVGDMYAWYNLLYKKAANTPDVLKATVSDLTKNKTTDEEKVKAIYYWVQDNIRYVAFEEGYSGFIPQTVQEVFRNKYGDCKGMANLMTEMLKLAGYDAHFSWIGTREIPYDRTEVQSLCVDNHAICVLYLKGKTYFLDGTEKFAPMGKNAYRIQGKSVLVQDGEKYKIETVPAANMEDNVMSTNANLELKDDKIVGHVRLQFEGEAKNYFHNLYNSIPADKRKTFVTKLVELDGSNTEATNIKTSDFTNRDIPLVLEGDIEISNRVTNVDNLSYTNIDFFPASIVSFSPNEERQTPYDLDNVFISKDEITLQLPPGAKIEKLPQPFSLAFNTNSIKAGYEAGKTKVVLTKKLELNSPIIFKKDFGTWKDFLAKIKTYNRNNITIVKN